MTPGSNYDLINGKIIDLSIIILANFFFFLDLHMTKEIHISICFMLNQRLTTRSGDFIQRKQKESISCAVKEIDGLQTTVDGDYFFFFFPTVEAHVFNLNRFRKMKIILFGIDVTCS